MGYHPAGGGLGACYVHLDGRNRPVAVVGSITIHDTDDRDNPPAPICGLDCDYSPLGRGHVMALQLGGPDVAENIVPQYQQWQQTGAWRAMERQAMQHAGAGNFVFAAVMTYGNTGDADASNYWHEFETNPTFYWNDERIPTRFQVWVLDASVNPGARLVTDILAPTAAATRGTAAAQLAVALTATPTFADFTVVGQMPAEDLAYWRSMEVGNTVSAAFDDYQEAYRQGEGNPQFMMSPRRETEAEFVQEYGDEVRGLLASNGWQAHEINQHASNTHMFQALYHEKPLKKRTGKNIEDRMKKHLKVKSDWSKRSNPNHESKRANAKKMLKRAVQGLNITHT